MLWEGSKLEIPSLERFYPRPCPELGLAASDISEAAQGRHYWRYRQVIKIIQEKVTGMTKLADVGCGSGYGTNLLRMHFGAGVFGVEPNDLARKYVELVFPECRVFNDLTEEAQVVVMVESIEHMTRAEARGYLDSPRVQAAVLTTPLVEEEKNGFHISRFVTISDVHDYMAGLGWVSMYDRLETHVTFTTGAFGDQYYGLFVPRQSR